MAEAGSAEAEVVTEEEAVVATRTDPEEAVEVVTAETVVVLMTDHRTVGGVVAAVGAEAEITGVRAEVVGAAMTAPVTEIDRTVEDHPMKN